MIILAAGLPTFERLFPSFQTQCATLYTILLPLATVLIVTGLIATVKHSYTPRSMVRPIITSTLIVMSIALWGVWTDQAKDALKSVVAQMDADPAKAAQRYVDILVSKEQPESKGGWFGLPSGSQVYEAVLWGILSIIGLSAQFLIWAAYIIQQFLVGLAYAFAPLFLGFLALRSTSQIGVRYIMGTVGILSWPLGWAAASIGTSNLIDVATEQGLVTITNVYSLQTILASAIIGGWIIITTLIAPIVIQGAVSSGAQVGSALLGGALTAGAAAVSTGATAGAALAATGTGSSGMFAGAATAVAGSMAGSTMQGGGATLSGSSVQSLAYNMPRARSSSTSSPQSNANQGESQSRTPASSQSTYNPKDVSNDGEVQQIIEQARENNNFQS